MPRRETSTSRPTPKLFGLQSALGHFRFRATAEPGGDPMVRIWRATYSHDEGWSYFQIVVNLSRNSCSFHRAADADYTSMLADLSESLAGPLTSLDSLSRVEALGFDFELIGLKMSREAGSQLTGGAFSSGTPGDWMVIQLYLPNSSDSFLLGLNDRLGAGEIVLNRPETGPRVLQALGLVFG